MRKNTIDTVLRVRLKHRPGQLAKLATALADQGALLGDIRTLRVGEEDTLREITIEAASEEATELAVAAVHRVEGVELLAVTDRVFERHRGGKLHSSSRVALEQISDLRYIYTPGVARVAKAIEQDAALAWELTTIGNSVGIFTNGTRVLGLGPIGALASMPVMEGKAVLYDALAKISATPILVDTTDVNEFIETVERVSTTFGGIHLEDIRIPDCYRIEEELIRRLDKPVMHDDQHGTATVALAAIINACAMTGVELSRARVGQIGLGAAGSAIARLALAYGVGEVIVTDRSAEAMEWLRSFGARSTDLATLMREADIVVATTGKPGLIEASSVRKGQVIFALSNPEPEIDPNLAIAAGASFASDGRSINNALAFPGLFRGALETRSRAITPEMRIAAARAIASKADADEVVPSPLDPRVHGAVRIAVADEARRLGIDGTARLARRTRTTIPP
jgi:malate dehydrogenase (oxaloacetate-decarboxylating)